MSVPPTQHTGDINVTVDFPAIKSRAADVLEVPARTVTHQQIADLVGASRKTITRYAKGRTASLPVVRAIAEKLGISIEQVMGGEPPR